MPKKNQPLFSKKVEKPTSNIDSKKLETHQSTKSNESKNYIEKGAVKIENNQPLFSMPAVFKKVENPTSNIDSKKLKTHQSAKSKDSKKITFNR